MNPRLKKAMPLILVFALALLVFVIRQCKDEKSARPATAASEKKETVKATADRDNEFDRRTSFLEYSNHAKCRMRCRKITQAEVEDIMKEGKINYNKSDLQNARCPRYVVEGITGDNQRTRIVFAQCNEKTTVVTVIDLDTAWSCDCPGDNKK